MYFYIDLAVHNAKSANMHYSDLITLAETLGSFLGKSEATISNYCAGHARFFSRLRDGKGCTVATFSAMSSWSLTF